MPKRIDYLLKRPGSQHWRLRLQTADGKATERSLGTSDRRRAEILALPLIAQHKAVQMAAKPHVETTWAQQYQPGLHTGLNGERIYATPTELHYLDENPIRIEPNGFVRRRLIARGPLSADREFEMFDEAEGQRQRLPSKDDDDAIIETYLRHAAVTGYYEREARDTWALYRSLVDRPLKDATRDDGRKLVEHFQVEGLKSATITKKIGWLNAACNLAMKEGKLKFNPFSSIVPKASDAERRLPLSDADIKVCMKSLSGLDANDALLFRLLAATGMRLSEALEIHSEATEQGYRYVIVGTKTEQSLRRVPLPANMLKYLPSKITKPLFDANAHAASKRLNRFLRDCGIVDRAKVVHSLRHRAADRLRAAGCPEDVRWAILGHEKRTVAASYGAGFPVRVLKQWIDKITKA